MNRFTEQAGPGGSSAIIVLTPAETNKTIVSLTVTDGDELVFMDTNLQRDLQEEQAAP